MIKVRNITSNNGNNIANQFIIDCGTMVIFQSYESNIIKIDYQNKTITVYADYNYSKTTGKYRNKFLTDFGFNEINTLKTLEHAIKNGFVKINNTIYTVITD